MVRRSFDRLLAFFDQPLDFLAAHLADRLVELRAIAVAGRLAALLASELADTFVELVTVRALGGLATLAADIFIEFGTVPRFDRLASLASGLAHRHTALGLLYLLGHEFGAPRLPVPSCAVR